MFVRCAHADDTLLIGKAARDFDSRFDSLNDFPDFPSLGHQSETAPIASRAHADFIQPSDSPLGFTPSIAVLNYQTFRPSVGSTIDVPPPPLPSLHLRSINPNTPSPLFLPTPNTYDYAVELPTLGPRQPLMPFDPYTLISASTHNSPAKAGGTSFEVYSSMSRMYEQGRGGTERPPGPEYQMVSQPTADPPNALFGWPQSQSPYQAISDATSPASPSRFQVPPESPSVPPTPALLSPSSTPTLYGTTPVLTSPMLPLSSSSYPNVRPSNHPRHTQAALPASQSRPPSYAEILSRGAPSVSFFAVNPLQLAASAGRPIPEPPVDRAVHQLRPHRLAPSLLRNVVPLPSQSATTVTPMMSQTNVTPGPATISPHPPILITPEARHYTGKATYTVSGQVNPPGVSVMTKPRMYSDAVKGKTKDPVQRVKGLHRAPQPIPASSSRPHNASNASVDRRSRPHSRPGLPYPPSPLSNRLQLHSSPGFAVSRGTPGVQPKSRFKGKRQGVDPCLRTAFDDGDPLKILLDRIPASDWCQRDEEEPIYGSQEDQITAGLALPTLQMHKSILFAFVQACTEKDELQCLICPKRLRTQRVLRHIRSHFDIRPFVCHDCSDCRQSKCVFFCCLSLPQSLNQAQEPTPCNESGRPT